MNRRASRLTPLGAGIGLLLAGAAAAWNAGDRVIGALLIGPGLVLIGVWVTLEIRHDDDPDDP